VENIVTNLHAKFNDDRLWNGKVLVLWKSYNNNPKKKYKNNVHSHWRPVSESKNSNGVHNFKLKSKSHAHNEALFTSFDVMQTSIASVWTCISSPLTGIAQTVVGDLLGSMLCRRNASEHRTTEAQAHINMRTTVHPVHLVLRWVTVFIHCTGTSTWYITNYKCSESSDLCRMPAFR